MNTNVELRPYVWEGGYAEMRSSNGYPHDIGLCADVRADWMSKDERIIIRSSEIVGFPDVFLYDDHFPPCESEGRGKAYEHIPFQWNDENVPRRLSAICNSPGKGKFSLDLAATGDAIDIELVLQSQLPSGGGNADWHFCVVGYDAPSLGDPEVVRTYLFDGTKLRSLNELQGGTCLHRHLVSGGEGFAPANSQSCPKSHVQAQASLVVVESADGKHSVALGFQQAHTIFSNPPNMCFHADPYFGTFTRKSETRHMRGKLYLMTGGAHEALARYRREFLPG